MMKAQVNGNGSFWYRKYVGSFMVFAPFLLITIMGLSALSVDMGILRVTHAELRNITDSAALAAVNALSNGNDAAINAAYDMASHYQLLGHAEVKNFDVQLGVWDSSTKTFTPTDDKPNAARVTANATPKLFFSEFYKGFNPTNENGSPDSTQTQEYQTSTSSTASVSQMNDIMFIVPLDRDSNFYNVPHTIFAPMPALELANLNAIILALNLPNYGNISGTLQNISSTYTHAEIKTMLGLTSNTGQTLVPYPFAAGSWDGYITDVKNAMPPEYKNQYGLLTFQIYLERANPAYASTSILWKGPQQPLQAIKDSVRKFINQSLSTNNKDKVGLITYDSSAHTDQLLTASLNRVKTILEGNASTNTPGKQAAHYGDLGTPVTYLSLQAAITELNKNGRKKATKTIFLFIDADTYSHYDTNNLPALAQTSANSSPPITIHIITIRPFLSQTATDLFQNTANTTHGIFLYNVGPNVTVEKSMKQMLYSNSNMENKAKIVQ